ncbi:peptidoglycan-binding protein [Micromonospora sp. NBC_00362]|uniref:peptidoglycan-binding protein n=1 Tax=Micromonospora sp. NBC_00362 TaxID=2975975 RepID=UPI002257F8FD|nr:peptidoglycan-binding protein [Micromonospora sp. NBC_00362]MCX5121993.1 peptidoglycan-binding protein [Micromonospora sp. NBC_00362]
MSDDVDRLPHTGAFVPGPADPPGATDPDDGGRPPRRRRRGVLLMAPLTLLAAAGAGAAILLHDKDGPAPGAAATRTATTTVTRTDLVQTQRVDGTLGYDGHYTVAGSGRAIVTWLPDVGTTLVRGDRAYAVGGVDVPLFYGGTPLYRELSVGVPDGPDVRVLKRNLKKLGHGDQLADDEHYSSGTADAVRDWQEDLGHEETGTVSPGDALVEPGPVRVTETRGIIGAPAEGELLALSGTERVVTVAMPVAQQQLARKGAAVHVWLPGGTTTSGKVTDVGTVADAPETDGRQGSTADRDDATRNATIAVRVSLTRPKDVGSLDGAPVSVDFTSDRRENVLAVPIPALLALAEGGYAVETPQGRLVRVRLGAFAQGKVEVSGDGVTEGMQVKVPRA